MNRGIRRNLPGLLVAAFGFCLAESTGAAPVITLDPLPAVLTAGDTFEFEINVSDLAVGVGPSLSGFQFATGFNAGVVAVTGVTFGTNLNGGNPANSTQSSTVTGTGVEISEFSLLSNAALDAIQPASFLVATIFFEAVGPGTATFNSVTIKGGPSFANSYTFTPLPGFLKGQHYLNEPLLAGSILVEASGIPEPESFLLVLTGLAGLAGLLRMERVQKAGRRIRWRL